MSILGWHDAMRMVRHFGGEILQTSNCRYLYREYIKRLHLGDGPRRHAGVRHCHRPGLTPRRVNMILKESRQRKPDVPVTMLRETKMSACADDRPARCGPSSRTRGAVATIRGDMGDPTLWDRLVIYGSSVIAWASGEAGRAIVAGAAGGLHRWLMSETRRLLDGVVAVVSGAIAAQFFGPVVIALLNVAGLRLQSGPDLDMTAGFIAGLLGMSLSKLIVAIVEAQARRLLGSPEE